MMELLRMIGNFFKLVMSLVTLVVGSIVSLFQFLGDMISYIEFYDSLLIPQFALGGISLVIAVVVIRIIVSHDL